MDDKMEMPQPQSCGYDNPSPGNPPQQQNVMQQPQAMPMAPGPLTQTMVIVQPQRVQVNRPNNFSTGLCACFDDMEICCLALLPYILGCQMASAMNESCCVPNCLNNYGAGNSGLMGMRIKARMQYNIGGTICNDWCTTYYCGLCAMCQLARELRSKGAM